MLGSHWPSANGGTSLCRIKPGIKRRRINDSVLQRIPARLAPEFETRCDKANEDAEHYHGGAAHEPLALAAIFQREVFLLHGLQLALQIEILFLEPLVFALEGEGAARCFADVRQFLLQLELLVFETLLLLTRALVLFLERA